MSAVQALRSRLGFGAGWFSGGGTTLLAGLLERVAAPAAIMPAIAGPRRAEALFRRHAEAHGAVRRALEIGHGSDSHAGWLAGDVALDHYDMAADGLPADLGDALSSLPSGCLDCVVSIDTIDHVRQPWRLAEEVERILRPGGFAFISTVFSAHPRPQADDVMRFTPDGLRALFGTLDCLTAEFDATDCRRDERRRQSTGAPADIFGGDREGWRATYCGRKPRGR